MLRRAIRLLVPTSIRRPIADRVYRTIARARLMRQWLAAHSGAPLPHRELSAARFAAARLARLPYVLARGGMAKAWTGASAHRHLLNRQPRTLRAPERAKRRALAAFLALPDPLYRRRLAQFERLLSALPARGTTSRRGGILLITGGLGPGGAERQAVLTLIGLVRRGLAPVELACASLRDEAARFFLPQLEAVSIPVREIDRDASRDAGSHFESIADACRSLPFSLHEVVDYARTIAALGPRVAHFWLDEVNVKGGLAAVAAGVPRVVLGLRSLPPLNYAFHQPYMREVYRWLAKHPRVVLLNNSAAGARAYEAWLGLSSGAVHVVHNGFDFDPATLARCASGSRDFRARHGLAGDAPVIGTVIRFSEEKRPLLWLEIAAALRRTMPEARFLVVGDGVLRDEVHARAGRADLRDAVRLVGHQRDALAAIAAMDVFLLTSRAEGLPNVLVEAQMLGVPVVTTPAGGAPETVFHGTSGWVLDRDDPAHVADVLSRLLHDRAWLSRARSSAYEFVREAFGVERMLDETLSIYGIGPVT